VGRRSRKRAGDAHRQATTREERDAARRTRASGERVATVRRRRRPGRPGMDERPPAPWGSFPLTELLVLVGIVLMGWGLATWSSGGHARFGAGLAIAALGGLELSVREHLGGFRSHTTLLSGVAAFVVVSVLALGPGPHLLGALVIIGAVVFAVSFFLLRGLFKRRSGGLGWR
jgi:hypothetical protein